MPFLRLIPALACTLVALCSGASALAQGTYPDRPVKVIVALPAGGSADMIARVVTQKMATELGQPFVVDNKAGASGQIGTPLVSRAAPDGYTLMVSPASFLTTNKSIFKTLPYDPEADFVPITKFVNQPMVLVVKDKQKFPTVAAVIAAAKAAPGKLTYASSGDGSPQHLAGLMFTTRTKTELLHVPYKGGAPAINDALAGTVDMLFAVLPEALPHIQSGKLRVLAVTGKERLPSLPDVPTTAEAGYPGVNATSWFGLFAPAATPKAVIDKLAADTRAVVQSAAFKQKAQEQGATADYLGPQQMADRVKADLASWADVVKASKIEAD